MLSKHRAIALTDDIGLQQEITRLLPDYDFHWNLVLQGAIHKAAELRPSFMLVDMEKAGWADIAIALQSNAATRRIPIVGIVTGHDEAHEQEARRISIDSPITRKDLPVRLPDWVADRARVWDDAYYENLMAGCTAELPDLARQGIELFNAREFWEAHEVLEHAWIEVRPAPIGELYRSILQIGVAYYQIQERNYWGAIKMFLRAIQWLEPLPDQCQGVDVAQFKRDAAAARLYLESLGEDRIGEFDTSLFKPVPMVKKD